MSMTLFLQQRHDTNYVIDIEDRIKGDLADFNEGYDMGYTLQFI